MTPDERITEFRKHIVSIYGGLGFGEILCYELHVKDKTFVELARQWHISCSFLGEVIADHCRKMDSYQGILPSQYIGFSGYGD